MHGPEFLNMILTEWNTEDAIAFARNEGREEGLSVEIVQKITGLNIEQIKEIKAS